MKFPFDFSITLIFRLIFPGLVLAIAFLPLAAYVFHAEKIKIALSTLIPMEAVVFGWLVVLLDQPIYMLYEGRRYWPGFLKRWMIQLQSASLASSLKKSEKLKRGKDSESKKEVDLNKLDFPLGTDGQPTALFPTALGNLLTAYETYPRKNYGIDAIFYWYRLWVVLDKDLRESMDQAQAMADSAIYVSFALSVSAVTFALYALSYWLAPYLAIKPLNLPYLPPPFGSAWISGGLIAAMYLTYRLGLHAQRQYGELFKALFDQFRDKLDFAKDAAELAVQAGAGQPEAIEQPHVVASRFLRYHRIRPLGETTNYTPEAWKAKSGHKSP